jgi:hypothetical protein
MGVAIAILIFLQVLTWVLVALQPKHGDLSQLGERLTALENFKCGYGFLDTPVLLCTSHNEDGPYAYLLPAAEYPQLVSDGSRVVETTMGALLATILTAHDVNIYEAKKSRYTIQAKKPFQE